MERFIHSERHVTSARIARAFGGDPEGAVTCAENLVVAPGLSWEAGEALIALVADGRVFWSPITRTAYHLDGLFLDLPVSYVQRPFDEPTWLPAAFNSPRVHRRVMEAIRLMGGVGLGPEILDPDYGKRLYEIQSEIKCERCGRCCTLSNPISLEPQDVERLSAHLGISIRKTIQRYAGRVEVGGRGAWAMKRTSPCIFLDEASGLCKIHPTRPIVCRAFPLLSPRTVGGEPLAEWCPAARYL
ncbi:MAG: YkgJ family cysteine cluster protein [Methanothrix sp.]|nr:YkgJ family cysteine cluster protein [Methanothrix sp.]MDD5768646.1 YkgJ family cysteine cluster protein [Methanothrix sp.]